jgi:glycosyltransferase involved in cell wall biosynthesis
LIKISLNFVVKITAIIPAYNASSYISEAIASVQNQTRPVDELIVIDDGSTDGTAELARSLGARVETLPINSGEGVARNTGLAMATGDAIAWLDADDYWAPNHIGVLEALIQKHPTASIACAAVQRFGLRNERITGRVPHDTPKNIFWYAVNDWVHPIIGTLMMRKALLDIGGFSIEKRASVDYDMWLRISRNHLFIATSEVTSYWRWHPAQQSQDFGAQLGAVYHFRRRYWDSEIKNGNVVDAKRYITIITNRWKMDFDRGCKNRDTQLCKAIYDCRVIIPGLKSAEIERRRVVLSLLRNNQCELTRFICLRCWLGLLKRKIMLRMIIYRYLTSSNRW